MPDETPLLGCESDRLVTKLGNGAIPPTSGNPAKSLKQKTNVVVRSWVFIIRDPT